MDDFANVVLNSYDRKDECMRQMRNRADRNGMRIRTGAATLLLAAVMLTGCGSDGKESYTAKGMTAVENLSYEEALEQFALAEENGEDKRLLYRGMGLAYLGMTDYENAILYLEAALQNSDGIVENMDFDISYYLATAYFKNGQAQEAIGAYDAILSLRPNERDACYLRGTARLSMDNYEGAQADFDRAIALAPQDYDQLLRIYTVLEAYGYKDMGQNYLQQAITTHEKSISDYDLGRIYYYMEDYENARTYLTNLNTETDYGAALYLGRTYEALGDYNYAASIYDGYTVNDQTKAEIYNQLGLCRIQMGEYELALSAFQTAMNIEDNGMMQILKFNEIVAYENMRDFKTAAALMNSYLKSYPDDETARREYDFLQTR